MGKFECLTELSAQNTIMAGYYSLTFLLCTIIILIIGTDRPEGTV